MSKINILPNFLINWLEDSKYDFQSCEYSDLTKMLKDILLYRRADKYIFIEGHGGITEIYFDGVGSPFAVLDKFTTEEEFLLQVINYYNKIIL